MERTIRFCRMAAMLLIMASLLTSCSNATEEQPAQAFRLSVSMESGGTVLVKKETYLEGENVLVVATPADGYDFEGWYEGHTQLSASPEYRFLMPNRDVNLIAVFMARSMEVPSPDDAIDLGLSVKWHHGM